MERLRKYGQRPFDIAVLHGGPGAPGEMAPVARQLSSSRGVLEPLQTATTIDGQVEELKATLENSADTPVTLIGFSWGAMLGFIFTARHPNLVKKLMLIGSAVYEEKYAEAIMATRLIRLNEEERVEVARLMNALSDPAAEDESMAMSRFGQLMSRADSYGPLPHDSEIITYRPDIYQQVWEQATELRRSGELLAMGKKIRCPVVAIHGDHDPHPTEGVKRPLSRVLTDFRFIVLQKCGHRPWIERHARDRFYDILRDEIE